MFLAVANFRDEIRAMKFMQNGIYRQRRQVAEGLGNMFCEVGRSRYVSERHYKTEPGGSIVSYTRAYGRHCEQGNRYPGEGSRSGDACGTKSDRSLTPGGGTVGCGGCEKRG